MVLICFWGTNVLHHHYQTAQISPPLSLFHFEPFLLFRCPITLHNLLVNKRIYKFVFIRQCLFLCFVSIFYLWENIHLLFLSPENLTQHNPFKLHPSWSKGQIYILFPCWVIFHCVFFQMFFYAHVLLNFFVASKYWSL